MKIAFVGSGGIARRHAGGLVKLEEIEVVGAFDVVAEQAQSFAAQFGGKAHTDLTEMLDEAKPEAVWVCLPPFAHGEAEMALLERGIPFLVEKPVSNSIEAARLILEQVESTGTLVSVGYMSRYRRGVNRAKELLADDPAILLHGAWIGGTPRVPWWRVKALSGGQIIEQTTHLFDLARYLVGEPTLVSAQGASGFTNTKATVIHKSPIEQEHIAGEANIFEIEDVAFVDAVTTGDASPVRSRYDDAVKTLAFCLAANKSLETGRPIEVDSI